jgi:hypothetical protein
MRMWFAGVVKLGPFGADFGAKFDHFYGASAQGALKITHMDFWSTGPTFNGLAVSAQSLFKVLHDHS